MRPARPGRPPPPTSGRGDSARRPARPSARRGAASRCRTAARTGGMLAQHLGDGLGRRLDHDRQAQGSWAGRSPSCTVCQGRPGRRRPPLPFDHADAAHDIVDQLVAAAEDPRCDGRAVVLQADPACDDHRRGQDQFQRARSLRRPSSRSCAGRRGPAGRGPTVAARGAAMKAAHPARPHSGPHLGPVGARGAPGCRPWRPAGAARVRRGPGARPRPARPRPAPDPSAWSGDGCIAIERHLVRHRVMQARPRTACPAAASIPCAGRPARVSGSFSSAASSRAETSPVWPPQAPQ